MYNLKQLHVFTYLLVIIGALNWGLIGAFDFNLVDTFFGTWPDFERVVYVLVGIAGGIELANHKSGCRFCDDVITTKMTQETPKVTSANSKGLSKSQKRK